MAKDSDCIFCKIASGEIPCCKLTEDDKSLAFMDIGPLAEGHVLVIPKEHFVTIDEMPADLAAAVCGHLPALARAVMTATGCAGLNVLQNNGPAAHQQVSHVHFHLIPRDPGDQWQFNWPAGQYPAGRMQQLADNIRQAL